MPMPDPFEALRTAPTPIYPDPAFAARLRARVVRALLPSQGDLNVTLQATDTANRLHQGDISFLSLWVADVQRASMFFRSVLGWTYADSGPGERLRCAIRRERHVDCLVVLTQTGRRSP